MKLEEFVGLLYVQTILRGTAPFSSRPRKTSAPTWHGHPHTFPLCRPTLQASALRAGMLRV